jgi:hypothetical protein
VGASQPAQLGRTARFTDTFTVRPADAQSGPSPIDGELSVIDGGDSNRLLQFDDEPMMRVIDVGTGQAREKAASRRATARRCSPSATGSTSWWPTTATSVREYDLAKLGEPRVVLTNTDDQRKIIARPARCGESRICMLEMTGSDAKSTQVVAGRRQGGQARLEEAGAGRQGADRARRRRGGVDRLLAARRLVFDGSGKQLLSDDAKKNYPVRVDGSSVLLVLGAALELPRRRAASPG